MNTDQIAAEAADTISDWIDQYVASSDSDKTLPKDRKAIAVIIKAAIEKATEPLLSIPKEGASKNGLFWSACREAMANYESRASHASEK